MSMSRFLKRAGAAFAAAGAVAAAVLVPAATASAATACVAPWSAGAVYWGGNTASYNGHNWSAKWWTQNETPGSADVWADQGACDGGGGTTPPQSGSFVVSEA